METDEKPGSVTLEKKGVGKESLPSGPVLSAIGEGREGKRAARGWAGELGLGLDSRSFLFFFFYFFSVSFSKSFPNRILKAQIISNQQKSTQKKICLSMNAKACC